MDTCWAFGSYGTVFKYNSEEPTDVEDARRLVGAEVLR